MDIIFISTHLIMALSCVIVYCVAFRNSKTKAKHDAKRYLADVKIDS